MLKNVPLVSPLQDQSENLWTFMGAEGFELVYLIHRKLQNGHNSRWTEIWMYTSFRSIENNIYFLNGDQN